MSTIALIVEAARLAASDALDRAWRHLSVAHHPDHGGDAEAFKRLAATRERMLAKKPEPVKPSAPVAPPRASEIHPAVEAFNTWCLTTEATLETVLDPCWLGPVIKIKKMAKHDRLVITHARGDYVAELLLVAIDLEAEGIAYKPIRIVDLTAAPEIGPDWETATVSYEGEQNKWAVRLGNRVAKAGWESEGLAQAYLAAKKLARPS